ncbi:hypothetical protein C8R44DRAFT_922957 [Mycena epipterygia]|nr:hypothetical protein C8R44DRAFT_922957 [Mycena epipterygia]
MFFTGALEIGVLVSYVLFGITTTQTYTYYVRFPDDPRGHKFLVCTYEESCEVAHLICIGQALYQVTITDFENPQRLRFVPTAIPISLLFGSIQGFFSLRIYRLSKSLYIPAFSWIMSFLRVFFSVLAAFYGGQPKVLLVTFEGERTWILYIIWVTSMGNDLIIAGTLVYWLHRQRVNAQTRPVISLLDFSIYLLLQNPCTCR